MPRVIPGERTPAVIERSISSNKRVNERQRTKGEIEIESEREKERRGDIN